MTRKPVLASALGNVEQLGKTRGASGEGKEQTVNPSEPVLITLSLSPQSLPVLHSESNSFQNAVDRAGARVSTSSRAGHMFS